MNALATAKKDKNWIEEEVMEYIQTRYQAVIKGMSYWINVQMQEWDCGKNYIGYN